MLQLLALPVSYSLAFQAGRVGYGGPILVAALAVLYLLFTPPARAALDRDHARAAGAATASRLTAPARRG